MEKVNLDINWQERTDESEYSVTQLLRYVDDPFNKKERSKAVSDRHFNDPTSEYYKMTPEQIEKKWADNQLMSQRIGHALDDYTGLVIEPERMHEDGMTMSSWEQEYGDIDGIIKLVHGWESYWDILQTLGYQFVKREQHFHYTWEGKVVRGRADMILYYPDRDTVVIVDWKTSKNIVVDRKKHFGLHGPAWVNGLAQEKLTHYGLQTNAYRRMLIPLCERPYNITTAIIQVGRDGTVHPYRNPIPYIEKDMDELMSWCINEMTIDPHRFDFA